MGKVTIELNKKNIGLLLKSDSVKQMLESEAKRHGGSWETDVKTMGTRAIASIYTTDKNKITEEINGHNIVGGMA